MAKINSKLIKYATQAQFDIDIIKVPAIVDSKSIVFVEDTGRIYAHGKYFGGAWGDISNKPKTFAPASHTHGSITNDGKIGTSAGRIIETTTGGALTHVAKNTAYNRAFGTGKDQVAMGNHTHAYLPLTGGKLTGDLEIFAANTDKFIKFAYNTTDAYAWRIGYLGTGAGNENRLAFQSAKANGASYVDALSFGLNDLVGKFAVTPTVGNTKVSLEGHNHALKLIAGASTATTNSTADVANPYIRLFSDNTHQGNIRIVGGTNVGVVSKNGEITFTATNTTYSAGTLALLQTGTNTSNRVWSSKILNDWLNPKLALKATPADISTAINGIEIGGRNLIIRSSEEAGTWIDTTGAIKTSGNHSTTDYIKVEPNKTYSLSKIPSVLVTEGIGGYWRNAWYDKDKVYISRTAETGVHNLQWKIPSNAHYVRLSYPIDSQPNFEKGTKATDWTPAPEDQVADWNETNVNSFAFIKNKPTKLTDFANNNTYALQTTSVTAGNGLTGGGTLASTRTITLGTPSTLTAISTNTVGTTNHSHAITTTTAGLKNTIVQTNSSGDINSRYFRSTAGNSTTISGAMAYRISSTDNYIRFCSSTSAIKTWLGLNNVGNDDFKNYGLGSDTSVNKNPDDFGSMSSGFYGVSTGAVGNPVAGSSGTLIHLRSPASGNKYWAQLHLLANGTASPKAFISHGQTTRAAKWEELYHTGNIPTWNQSTTGNAKTASAVSTSAENSSTASRYILFANSANGNQALKTDSGLKYVPSTNTISATFSGDLTGNASSSTTAESLVPNLDANWTELWALSSTNRIGNNVTPSTSFYGVATKYMAPTRHFSFFGAGVENAWVGLHNGDAWFRGAVTATSFLGKATSAGTSDLANTLTINSSASASWFNILWNSGTTVYGSTNNKLRVQPSTGSVTSGGTITASGGNSSQWNSAYSWGNHAGKYSSRAGGLGAASNSIEAKDTRSINPLPNTDLQRGVWFDFKTNSAIGLTGASTYSSVITMVPYGDNSGNSNTSFRLAQSGNNLYFQNWTTVWGTWNKLWHSGNSRSNTENDSRYLRIADSITQSVNGLKTFTSNITSAGFVKTGSNNNYVLLAGGGHATLSGLSGSHSHNDYVTKASAERIEGGTKDLNSYLIGGFYNAKSGIKNYPHNHDGALIVLPWNSAGYVSQILTSAAASSSQEMYFRNNTNSTGTAWTSWAKVWTDKNHGTNSGLNADKVRGQAFNWTNTSNSPTYLWATSANGTAFLASRANISVKYADTAGSADSSASSSKLTGNGGITTLPGTSNLLYTGRISSSDLGSMPYSSNANGIITMNTHSGNYHWQLGFSSNGSMYSRSFMGTAITEGKAWDRILDSSNSSVSGKTITINGTSTTWVDTHRGIKDNLTSQNNKTESLSAHQGYLLANGSARDNTKLALSGGTMTGNTVVSNYGIGNVGRYSASRYQNVFSMGAAYVPSANGTSLGNMYGIAWTHTNVGGQSKAGLSHQALFVEAGVTKTAIGTGIWTSGSVTASGFIGNASTATALTTNAGSATRPVYFSGGKPVQGTYTFGNASGNAPISNGVVNVNLNAAMLAGYTPSSFLLGRRMENPSDGTSEQGAIPFILALKAAGRPVYTDPEFSSGNGNVGVYDNGKQGSVSVTRVSNTSAANSSGYVLEIATTSGTASPGRGGFVQAMPARANAVLCQIFRAKIPVGFSVYNAENSMGTGRTTHWLTDKAGTGKWEWYCRVTICGPTGSFSSGGHVYLNGSGAVTWQLAYCNVIDLSKGEYDGLRTRFADSADTATTATALITNAGSKTQPVYFSGGKPVACTTYANASVKYATSAGTATSAGSATNATNTTNIDTLADNATNAARFILFSDAATGNQRAKTDTGLKYNPSSNTITAALTGNASSATKLQTSRTIWGQSFDGSASISGILSGVSNITMTGTIGNTSGTNKLDFSGSNNTLRHITSSNTETIMTSGAYRSGSAHDLMVSVLWSGIVTINSGSVSITKHYGTMNITGSRVGTGAANITFSQSYYFKDYLIIANGGFATTNSPAYVSIPPRTRTDAGFRMSISDDKTPNDDTSAHITILRLRRVN